MLFAKNVYIEPKPFSIGFRIEHPQRLIDECRFGGQAGHKLLGAADYKLVHHCKNGRSVYSFCMCPGGMVVAAASEAGRLVTNGMSQYSRSEKNANSAIVVGITPEDYPENALGGIELQRRLEEKAYQLGKFARNGLPFVPLLIKVDALGTIDELPNLTTSMPISTISPCLAELLKLISDMCLVTIFGF